jgi:hypothetical protein
LIEQVPAPLHGAVTADFSALKRNNSRKSASIPVLWRGTPPIFVRSPPGVMGRMRNGTSDVPAFQDAVVRHRLPDAVEKATGTTQTCGR